MQPRHSIESALVQFHQVNIFPIRRFCYPNSNFLLAFLILLVFDLPSSVGMLFNSSINPDCTEIIAVRHGETEWNATGRFQGQLDVELNNTGRQQAAAVAQRLSGEPNISAIYSSDLQRAFETAQIIAASSGGLEVVKDPNLRERHLGDLQGLLYREAAKTNPKAYRANISHSPDREIPDGGESLAQLYERCTSAFHRIRRKHKGERVIVVTHGGVIRALHKRTCPKGRRPSGNLPNTCINVFHLYDGDKWTLKAWGDVSHLNQTGFQQSGFGSNTDKKSS